MPEIQTSVSDLAIIANARYATALGALSFKAKPLCNNLEMMGAEERLHVYSYEDDCEHVESRPQVF